MPQTVADSALQLSQLTLTCVDFRRCTLCDFFCLRGRNAVKRSTSLLTWTVVWSGSLRFAASSYGLAYWFKCNFILWENTLTKGNSCLGVMTFCPRVKWETFWGWLSLWFQFLLKQTLWRECDVQTLNLCKKANRKEKGNKFGVVHAFFVRKTTVDEYFCLFQHFKTF